MVRSTLFIALVAAFSASLVRSDTAEEANEAIAFIPGAYIFEFEDNHDTSTFRKKVADEDTTTRMELDYKLFKGVSIQFNNVEGADEKAAAIADLPAVKQVWPVRLVQVPDSKVEWVGDTEMEPKVPLEKRAVNISVVDTFTPHVMTQVDQLRADGITGKGFKVAVVDTGIDYTHPALGGCFGSGCLVSFGTDFVGDAYTGSNLPQPDSDPMDCQGHGTHVAGTVAAQDNYLGFTGGAPDVSLGAYRAFGCSGNAANDVLIAAFNQAYEDGADIITCSVAGPGGWSEDPWAVAISRIVEQGVPCTLAAGNSGSNGPFYASYGGVGKDVTAVASFDNTEGLVLLTRSYYTSGSNTGDRQEFGYAPGSPSAWTGVTLPLWTPPSSNADGCSAFESGTSLSGKIALLRQSTACTVVAQAQRVAAAGGQYLTIYTTNVAPTTINVSSVTNIKAAAMVTKEQGEQWATALTQGTAITLQMYNDDGYWVLRVPNPTTGGGASFTSQWGPSWEMEMKPQFGAPGTSILSTYPIAKGGYAILSGTSMATPLVAAIYALIGEVRGTLDPTALENLMSANSDPALYSFIDGFHPFYASVAQQGGGLVRAYDAAHATTLLSPSGLSFNETAHLNEVLNFTLTNTSPNSITYSIGHVPAISFYTFKQGATRPSSFPPDTLEAHATLRFSEDQVTLAAGETVTVEVIPTAPANVDERRLPVWSGWIAVNGTDGSSLSIPYQGASGSLHDHALFNPTGSATIFTTTSPFQYFTPNTQFILPTPGSDLAGKNLLLLGWYLNLGSRKVRAEIVPVGTSSSDPIGQADGFPVLWNPRNQNTLPWSGKLDNGDYAPAGTYKVVFRALRIFGDETVAADWDSSETVPFIISYA